MARRSRKRAGKEHLDGSPNHQEAQEQPAEVNAEKPQLLYPETESTLPTKDRESKMVEEKEVGKIEGEERNEPNQLCNEPDSTPPKETIKKSVQDLESEHPGLCPKLDPLSPKDSNPVLLHEPEPVVVKNETNGLSTGPDSTTPRKRGKRKGKSLSTSEGTETNNMHSKHRELIPNLDPSSPKDSDPILLPEPGPVAQKNETNELCTEPESATPRKKRRKRKGKSLSTSEGAETKDVQSEHHELVPNLDPLSLKDSDPVQLPEPEPVVVKNETNGLSTEPDSKIPRKKKRKRKGKSLSTSEGIETNDVHSKHHELTLNLDPLSPKDSNPIKLLEPEPVAEKNKTNQLCTEPESATPRKKKRKRKGKSLSTSEGTETNDRHSEHCELIPNLDPLLPKDSDSVLLPEPEPFAEKNDANQLCIEAVSTPSRNMKRKRKRKSVSKSEVVEANHVDYKHHELCPNLAALPPKDPDPRLLRQPAPVGEKSEANQLYTKPDSTSPKFEGAEIKDMDFENLELCPKLDTLPAKDSDSLLLPQSEPAPVKEVDQKKKRKNKKKKKKSISEDSIHISEGVECGPWVPKGPLKDYKRYRRCLGCRQICKRGQKCRGRIHLNRNLKFCFFCGKVGHSLGRCPFSPGARCGNGIIMLDDYVRKACGKYRMKACREKFKSAQRKVTPANVPTYAPIRTPLLPSNIQPYPAPFVRPIYAPFAAWGN